MVKIFSLLIGCCSLLAVAGTPNSSAGISTDSRFATPAITDDQESSAGGWGRDCTSGLINCLASGRQIGCKAELNGNEGATLCTQHIGDVGWISCQTLDPQGYTTSSYFDQCP